MSVLLNPNEQALLRGWMQHLGWPLLGQLYADGADIATTRRAVAALRQRLATRAKQCDQPALAAFWSSERQANSTWQVQADMHLRRLLDLPPPLPNADDAISRWLDDKPARALQAAGMTTLAALLARRQTQGRCWWRAVAGFGAQSARQVDAFFSRHADALHLHPAALAATKPHPPAVFFHTLYARRPDLAGSHGSNRAAPERCRIAAADDYAAIQAWLALRTCGSHTARHYRKETERFLLWAVAERGKPLSALDSVDCQAYRDFLRAPGAAWIASTAHPRWSPQWRPFKGPLGPRNLKHALTIVAALCGWLVKQRYLDANPFDGLPPLRHTVRLHTERALEAAQWQWLIGYCQRCAAAASDRRQQQHYRRLWITLQLAYCTGLRIAELAAARFGHVHHSRRNGGQYWLHVQGKGGKPREVPLPAGLVTALQTYAAERGLCWHTAEAAPLIGKQRQTAQGLFGETYAETTFSAVGLHGVLQRFFKQAAAARATEPSGDAEQDARDLAALSQLTPHWLRHTHATHALNNGTPLLLVKENLGHASLATTSAYLHGDRDQRHRAMDSLFKAPPA